MSDRDIGKLREIVAAIRSLPIDPDLAHLLTEALGLIAKGFHEIPKKNWQL